MDRGDCENIPAKVMWRPQWAKATLMTRFREGINSRFHLALTDYHQLYKWSCENYRFSFELVYSFSLLCLFNGGMSVMTLSKRNGLSRFRTMIADEERALAGAEIHFLFFISTPFFGQSL